jgi:glyoxylase-like metal-dependent hydrolase (beta-lactamase superfamily II)
MDPSDLPLEDTFEDILSKALRGLGMTQLELSEQTGFHFRRWKQAHKPIIAMDLLLRIANTLNLNASALQIAAACTPQPYHPKPDGLAVIHSRFGIGDDAMWVNSWLVALPDHSGCILFDTGTDLKTLLSAIEATQSPLKAVFFTHGHRDHCAVWKAFHERYPNVPAYAHPAEAIPYTETLEGERTVPLGPITLFTRSLAGHSPGALIYECTGLSEPILITGDTIFASSMGGIAATHYTDNIRILKTLLAHSPENCLICPGHGPLSHVSLELQRNPFLAQS